MGGIEGEAIGEIISRMSDLCGLIHGDPVRLVSNCTDFEDSR